jgi:two-component system, NarL family, response regulator LiaR
LGDEWRVWQINRLKAQNTLAIICIKAFDMRSHLSLTFQEIQAEGAIAPLKILIVEDDPLMRMGLKQFLATHRQIAIAGEATDGYSAIDAVGEIEPDLVLMDVGLPQLDGIEATRQIKAEFPALRVLMLTSHEEETEIVAALSCGADGYCIKGTSLRQLLGAIAVVQEGAVYLDPQIARAVIAHLQPPRGKPSQIALSPRELEILNLLVEGRTNPEIAQSLYLSLSTVKAHIRSIMNKLAVSDRVQAAVVALRSGLV